MRLIVCLLALGLTGMSVAGCDREKQEAPQAEVADPNARQGEVPCELASPEKGASTCFKGHAAPATVFKNPDGGDFTLAKFQGSPVLVNLWASWCAPCIKELPTLQKLEESHAADGALGVIAVSQDMAPQSSVDAFLKDKGIARFAAYHDEKMGLTDALNIQVMPTTILYDADGKEVWRYVGDLDWSGDEAKALLAEAGPKG